LIWSANDLSNIRKVIKSVRKIKINIMSLEILNLSLKMKKIRIFIIVMSSLLTSAVYGQNNSKEPLDISIIKAHERIWSEFMDMENGLLYDYVGADGDFNIPTPDECKASKPNALSWWVPNENGAFFNGIYLDALCKRWKIEQDNVSASQARKVAAGLQLLAFVGEKKGFIARGISTDGVSHFPASSPDQLYPWFYGLWHYVESGIPNEVEQRSVIAIMEEVATALEGYGWKIPCERDDLAFFGDLTGSDFSDCARLQSILRFMHVLTGQEKWIHSYYHKLKEKPAHSTRTRLEILENGLPIHPPDAYNSFWTSSMDQAALKELWRLERNDTIRSKLRHGLDTNAKRSAAHIVRYRAFENDNDFIFNPDWRVLNQLWKPQKTMTEALELAELQLQMWDEISPRKGYELFNMMEPLNASWIVVLSGNTDIIHTVKEEIRSALIHYDWSTMKYSTFFIAECVYYEGLQQGIFE
jgi:hypothetical protein